MNPMNSPESRRLAEMRRTFDRSFAAPAGWEAEDLLPLIVIRLAGETMVLRADHVTGIAKCGRIVPIASRIPALLGITGMRGALAPVFSLAALLGLTPRDGECLWLAMAHRESPVALAFDKFEGQVEVKRTCLYDDGSAPPRLYVRQLARIGSSVRAVIDVPSIVDSIRRAAEPARRPQ